MRGVHVLVGILGIGLQLGKASGAEAPLERQVAAERLAAYGVEEMVFAERTPHDAWGGAEPGGEGHWYANFGYYAWDAEQRAYREGTRLCKLNLRTGEVTALVDDPGGTIRDPVVHYDGHTLLFSYRPADDHHFHLFEVQSDGTGLRQLTEGKYDDIEPTYLPDGGIMFVSSRAKRWVQCWCTQVATLHRCNRDGSGITQISANVEQDNTPWVLPDGRVLYQRWEYVDRSQVNYHHLWSANPDGTAQTVFFGNMHPGRLFIDAKPVPGSDKIVLINSPGHGRREHEGAVALLSRPSHPDDLEALRDVTEVGYRDPWALSEDCIIAARQSELTLIDGAGAATVFHRSAATVHEPRPLLVRTPERVIPPRSDPNLETGTLLLADVYVGRNMEGIGPGDIKKLLVLESLPKPINYTGGMAPMSANGTFTLERILGTVPVEEDGSAHLELPAKRAFILVALDGQNRAVKRMQSFLSVMPGEVTSCVGCHEQRSQSPSNAGFSALMAAQRPPSRARPLEGVPDILDFPRDVQPILDKHCVPCHNPDKPEAGVQLTGDHGPIWSVSFYTLTARAQFIDGRNKAESNYPPYALGDAASPLMAKLEGGHHEVKATGREREIVRAWINIGAPYPGTYAALGTGMIGGYQHNVIEHHDLEFPEVQAMRDTLVRRCGACHAEPHNKLPLHASDESQNPTWVPIKNPRFQRHVLYNLTRPAKSTILLAPLAEKAGGYAGEESPYRCQAVIDSKDDPDYLRILAGLERTTALLNEIKRFDMPGFQPRKTYLREMVRYGVLPEDFDPATPIDVYALDRKYFEALWYYPPGEEPALHDTGMPPVMLSADPPRIAPASKG